MKNKKAFFCIQGLILFLFLNLFSLSLQAIEKQPPIILNQYSKFDLQVNNVRLHSFHQPMEGIHTFNNNLRVWQKKDKPYKRKSPLLAATMNFFLPGTGYLYNGQKHPLISLGMMAGAIGLTYVELNLQNEAPDLYPYMFGSVFVLNTSIAIDTFIKTKEKNEVHNL